MQSMISLTPHVDNALTLLRRVGATPKISVTPQVGIHRISGGPTWFPGQCQFAHGKSVITAAHFAELRQQSIVQKGFLPDPRFTKLQL